MKSRVALLTGVTGQDGAYLCRDLLAAGWRVRGAVRPGADDESLWRLYELGLETHPGLELEELDLGEPLECENIVMGLKPTAIFHLAAISSVAEAFEAPIGALRLAGNGCLNLLEPMRLCAPDARFVFASSAELFEAEHVDESSRLSARHPYALAKLTGHAAIQAYRSSFLLHASNAILFNHESPLRDARFVTQKIVAAAARASTGGSEVLALGNLDVMRDFGYAPDYVAAMLAMALHAGPDDYVLATGVATSIRDFASAVYAAAGIDLHWEGEGLNETACDAQGVLRVRVDRALMRRVDASVQRGDASRARRELGFAPSLDIAGLARTMLDAEMRRLAR